MSTFSKPSAVVNLIDDAITAKVRAHVPTDQIYQKPDSAAVGRRASSYYKCTD